MVDRLDAAGCSFVSVTQAFNTSSAMGRLMLNMLLSFAQFEREVTSEWIRDKIAASKKKGLWMDGVPPIGYDPHLDPMTRKLVVNEAEAATIWQLFMLYETHGCLTKMKRESDRLGLRFKRHLFSTGRVQGGNAFKRGQIYSLLRNPVYLGKIRHKDRVWPGTHAAIIDQDIWDRFRGNFSPQARDDEDKNRRRTDDQAVVAYLTGLFRDETSDLLTPSHTQRHGQRLRYYISNRLISGGTDPSGWRLLARAFEDAVATTDLAGSLKASDKSVAFAARIRSSGLALVAPLISSGDIARGQIGISLDAASLTKALQQSSNTLNPALTEITAPFTCRRGGIEMKTL